jgi:hypothetical protein
MPFVRCRAMFWRTGPVKAQHLLVSAIGDAVGIGDIASPNRDIRDEWL